ncbi:MAG: hypothetical protein DMF44_14750 [Verrucomicrobia bacterium]|nr:MAG: hypothetical protein DMF44_14750 [Verrucomicrobiota bacterium]
MILQAAVVAGQNQKSGVTVSYESLGSSRIARFTNSNSFHVRVEFSYQGTRVQRGFDSLGRLQKRTSEIVLFTIAPLQQAGAGL